MYEFGIEQVCHVLKLTASFFLKDIFVTIKYQLFSTDDFCTHERRTPLASRWKFCFKLKMSYHEYAAEVITVIVLRAAQKQTTGVTNVVPVLRMNGAVQPLLPYICVAWFFVMHWHNLTTTVTVQCRCRHLLTKKYSQNSLSLRQLPISLIILSF